MSNISEFLFALDKKTETYWNVLKNTMMNIKDEISNKVS